MKLASVKYPLIAVGLVAVWVFSVYLPFNRKYNDGKARVKVAQQRLRDFEVTLGQLQEYIESCKSLESSMKELNERLYTKKDVIKLFQHLGSEADTNQLELVEITPPIEELLALNEVVQDTSKPLFLNIGLRLKGGYTDFGRFVKSVEKSPFYRGTKHCQITGAKEDIKELLFDYSFTALLGGIGEQS